MRIISTTCAYNETVVMLTRSTWRYVLKSAHIRLSSQDNSQQGDQTRWLIRRHIPTFTSIYRKDNRCQK